MTLGAAPEQQDVNEMNRKKGKKQTNDQKVLWKVLPYGTSNPEHVTKHDVW